MYNTFESYINNIVDRYHYFIIKAYYNGVFHSTIAVLFMALIERLLYDEFQRLFVGEII
jgi:hypothetical protein